MDNDAFEFLTANTGHTCMIDPAKDITPNVVTRLMPLVRNRKGSIPGLPEYSITINMVRDAIWTFDISGLTLRGPGSIVRCVVCMANQTAKEAWQYVLAFSNDGSQPSLRSLVPISCRLVRPLGFTAVVVNIT